MKVIYSSLILAFFLSLFWTCSLVDNRYLNKAIAVENWLKNQKVKTESDDIWADEIGKDKVSISLSSGVPGTVLFYLELYKASKDQAHLDEALLGCNYMRPDSLTQFWSISRYGFMGGEKNEPATFTGYFYGSAGLGLLYVRLHNLLNGKKTRIKLPDDPF